MTTFTEEIDSSTTKLQKSTEQSSLTDEIISTDHDEPTEQLISTNEITSNEKNNYKAPIID